MSKAKGFHKKPSKRVTLKRKYKIEKKVREHNRKVKKLARKNNKGKSSKARQPVPMPRSAPFSLEWDGATHTSNKEKRLNGQNEELAEIVTELAPTFDIENPTLDQVRGIDSLDQVRGIDTLDQVRGIDTLDQVRGTDGQDVDGQQASVGRLETKRNQLIGLQVNKERRNRLKQLKRSRKRGEKRDRGSEQASMDVNEGEDYDFETDDV